MISIVFMVLAVLCLGYYIFAASYAGINSAFLWFWLVAGLGSIIVAVGAKIFDKYNIMQMIPKWIKVSVIVIVTCGVLLFVFLEGCVISGMFSKPVRDADYVIVLGAQIKGTRVTKSLAKRLDAAYEYAVDNKDCIIVVSGGQGVGEDTTEAEAMKRYLVDKGIEADRIIEEGKSTSTKENLLFSKEIIDNPEAEVVIATNNFHVFRAKRLAGKMGYKNISGVPAPSDNRLILNYMVREGLAIFKEKLLGNI
ncbi:MAG: YdcF family protein [Lachnospiraceae bacterium]|nr:YdcF family protein [Lachnospiraceae bacterium]